MGYINQFKLIQYIEERKKLDSKKLLAEVDREKIINVLKKSKEGLPRCFNCTNEPIEEENWAKIPISDKKKLWKIYRRMRKSPEKQLPKLLELKKKYPNVPAIYNYLGIVYANCNQNEKYFNTITETLQKFTSYLFGKIALAEYYLNNNGYKKIPKIFDGKFEIYMHFPPTVKIFHVSEVRAFYSVIGIYYSRINKQARALFCYFLLEGIDPSHFSTRKLGDEIILQEIDKLTRIRHKSK